MEITIRAGLIFSPGSFEGCEQVGQLEPFREFCSWARREHNINIEVTGVQGSSVGSFLGFAITAEGKVTRRINIFLEKQWKAVEAKGSEFIFPRKRVLLDFLKLRFYKDSLCVPDGVYQLIDNYQGLFRKIASSKILLQILVFNENKQQIEVITNRDRSIQQNPYLLREWMRATTAIQGIFPPIVVNGAVYSDPRIYSIASLLNAEPKICDAVFVFSSSPTQYREPFFLKLLPQWVRRLHLGNFLDKELPLKKQAKIFGKRVIIVRPKSRVKGLRKDKFSKGAISRGIEFSRREAEEFFSRNKNIILRQLLNCLLQAPRQLYPTPPA